ncbi:hypothetical protein [Rhizobium leguminosarum]|uniref:hypothetical protein n=1 Tax=Rhizobium leguminosarum TaxID=384 RepID=UPI003F9AE93D
MDRRSFIVAASAVMASMVAKEGNAQAISVPVDTLGAVLGDDQKFARMRLSMAALRLNLSLIAAVDDPDAIGQYNGSNAGYFAMADKIEKERPQLLQALKQDSSPVVFSAKLNSAVIGVEERLAKGGIEPKTNLSNELMANLQVFLAATSKSGENVDDWFCSTFPFSAVC